MSKNTVEDIQKWMGKRVQVIDSKGEKYGGILEFIGPNLNFPSWGMQVTICRLPITNVDLDNITLMSETTPIFKKLENGSLL